MIRAPKSSRISPWALLFGSFAALVLLPVIALAIAMALLPACLLMVPLLLVDFWPESKEELQPHRGARLLPPKPVGA